MAAHAHQFNFCFARALRGKRGGGCCYAGVLFDVRVFLFCLCFGTRLTKYSINNNVHDLGWQKSKTHGTRWFLYRTENSSSGWQGLNSRWLEKGEGGGGEVAPKYEWMMPSRCCRNLSGHQLLASWIHTIIILRCTCIFWGWLGIYFFLRSGTGYGGLLLVDYYYCVKCWWWWLVDDAASTNISKIAVLLGCLHACVFCITLSSVLYYTK